MTLIKNLTANSLLQLLHQYGIEIIPINDGDSIPGSYWGEPEAGIILNRLYVRNDTPVHSALHESCHYICMDKKRRAVLHTNTGGDYDEENAVCYLQIILSEFLDNVGRAQLCNDMDEWGYTFRLGSANRWFKEDADDAKFWLQQYNIIHSDAAPTWKVRQ